MKNMINWFEIPVIDFDRAKKFYEKIFDAKIEVQDMMGFKMGFFPYFEGKVSGSLVKGEGYTPNMNGTLVYLNGNPDLNTVLNRITGAGGKVLVPKTQITPEIGYFAIFTDCEGNKVALHSQQ
ncbi:MAG: VOC family protein [Ignavibacteriae bacterium]|nr:VOC family protein [Ignavibacteriota bacterium]